MEAHLLMMGFTSAIYHDRWAVDDIEGIYNRTYWRLPMNDNNWEHIKFTYDGIWMRCYVTKVCSQTGKLIKNWKVRYKGQHENHPSAISPHDLVQLGKEKFK